MNNHFLPKFLLTALFIIFAGNRALAASPQKPQFETFTGISFNIPKTVYQKEDFTLSTLNLTYGLKITAGILDARFYQGSSKKPCWSLALDLNRNQPKIPLTLTVGTLSFGQTVSYMKNPAFYTNPSPLSGYLSLDSGLGISKAQKSASEKPVAAAVSLKTKTVTIDAAVTEHSDVMAAAAFRFQPSDFLKTSVSCAVGTFDLAPKTQTSWKTSNPSFSDEKQVSLCLQLLASVPLFSAKIATAAVSNPFGQLRFFTTFDFFFHYNSFSISGGIFAADTCFIKNGTCAYTMASSPVKNLCQFKINPRLTFYFDSGASLKTGIVALYDYSVTEEGYNRNTAEKLSFASSTALDFSNNYISLLYKMNMCNYQDMNHSFSVIYSHWFEKMSLSLTARESFSSDSLRDKKEHSETFTVSTGFKEIPLTGAGFTVNLDHKNNAVTPKFTLGLTASQSLKNVKFTGKIQVCTTLLVEQ